jgi:hypothetical protein
MYYSPGFIETKFADNAGWPSDMTANVSIILIMPCEAVMVTIQHTVITKDKHETLKLV